MPQDYSHRNLQQESFIGQDLTGANFTGADIRGTDFSNAILINTNFTQTQAGLPPKLITRLQAFAHFLALLSGFITAYAGAIFGQGFTGNDKGSAYIATTTTIALIAFTLITLKKGLGFALGLLSLIAATTIVLIVALTPSEPIAGQTALSSLALGGAIAGTIGLSTALNLNRTRKKLTLTIAIIGIVLGSLLGISVDKDLLESTISVIILSPSVIISTIGVIILSPSVIILSKHITKATIAGDPRYQMIQDLTSHLTTIGSTRFTNANLTNANFTEAILSSTNFRNANRFNVCWINAKGNQANFDRTFLTQQFTQSEQIQWASSFDPFREKDQEIYGLNKTVHTLKELIGAFIERPTVQIENINNRGEFVVSQDNKGSISLSGIQGNVSGLAAAGETQTLTGVAIGAISGQVTNTINALPETSTSDEPTIKELLTELQTAIETDPTLSNDDKTEALEQLKTIIEAGKHPKEGAIQKTVKTAFKILKGTIADLPDTEKLFQVGIKVLPLIAKFFGF